jgi:hypothetical protein
VAILTKSTVCGTKPWQGPLTPTTLHHFRSAMLSPATSKTHSRPIETSSDLKKENILCEFREQRTRARKNTTESDSKWLREKFWTAGAVLNSTVDKLFPDSSIHRSILKGALHQGVLDLRALPPSIREELPRELHVAWKEQHAVWKQLYVGGRLASSHQIQDEIEYLPKNEWVFIDLEDHSNESSIDNLYTVMERVDESGGPISQPYRYLHKISHMFLDLKQGGRSVHDLPESERSRIQDVTRKFFEGISPVCSKARLRKACKNFYTEIYSGAETNRLKSIGMISRYRMTENPDIKIRINARIQALHGPMPGIPKFEKNKRAEVGKYNPEYLNQAVSRQIQNPDIETLTGTLNSADQLPPAKQRTFWSHQNFAEPRLLTRVFKIENHNIQKLILSNFVNSKLKLQEKAEIFRSGTCYGSIDTNWTQSVGHALAEALRKSVKDQDCVAFEHAFTALQTMSLPISIEVDLFCEAMCDDTGQPRVMTNVAFHSKCMEMFETMANRVTTATLKDQRELWRKMGESTPTLQR